MGALSVLGQPSDVTSPDAASNKPTSSSTTIEELTVYSTRGKKYLREVPAAISVIDKNSIQRGRQQLGLDESLNAVPGVFSQNRYNYAQDLRIAIRGFGARANFGIRGIRIYSDGIPATLADGQSGVDDIDLGSTERIEVIRGPSSSLYGASSGGVINLYSEEGPEIPFIEARVTLGEYGMQNYQIKTGGQSGKLNYLANISHFKYEGYRDLSSVESSLLNTRFRYDFNSDSDFTVILNLVDSPSAQDSGAITSTQVREDPRQAQQRNISSNAGEKFDQQKLGFVYHKNIGEHQELTVRNYYLWRDFSTFLPIGTHINFVPDDGVVSFDRFFYGGGIQYSFSGELFGKPYETILGIDADVQKDDRLRFLNEAGVRGQLSFDQIEKAEILGLYIRNEYALSDAVDFVLGIRYDSVKLSVSDKFGNNGDQSSNLDFEELSPTVGFVWEARENLSFYANYSTAFETPTFTELASPPRNLDVSLGGFTNVVAQQAKGMEIGLKGSFLGERIYLDIAAFSMQVDDEITNVINIGDRAFFDNADTDRQGLEVYAVAELTTELMLSFAYTFSDFKFDKFSSNEQFEGNYLPGLPENQAYIELEYQHDSGVYLVGDVLYVDKLYVNNANTFANKASVVTNIRAGYSRMLGNWKIEPFLGINNVFDERYNSNVRINGFGGRLFEPGPPLNIYGGIALRMDIR
ncbi:MAG: TonB-dependent receptor [Pseudomonadales bacterium]|nr:TonB-dependent receptor [Pseudomonadales bacterium]